MEDLLKKAGFVFDHATGSHYIYRHTITGKTVTVPFHGRNNDLAPGTRKSIKKETGV
jgi:predicted RNA binding protein YcfA (HicA-like mRNA interferase family)